MKKVKKIWRRNKRKVKKNSLSFFLFLRKYLLLIISMVLIGLYFFGSYLLWYKLRVNLGGLKDVLTIQIQLTALLIGMIAGAIGLYNFWRKTGIKLLIKVESNMGDSVISIQNLKDKEIAILNLYIYILIDKRIYMLDVLRSAKIIEKKLSIKAYGYEHIELDLPTAIKLKNDDPLEEKYIYTSPIIKKRFFASPHFNNIIFSELRGKKPLTYLADTSEGIYESRTIVSSPFSTENRLVFCDKEELFNDYRFIYENLALDCDPNGTVDIDLKNISDEQLDQFVRDNETNDNLIKQSKPDIDMSIFK